MAGGLRLDALLIGSGPPDATGGARRQLLVNQSIGEQQRQRLLEDEMQMKRQEAAVNRESDVNTTAIQLARVAKNAWDKLPPEQRTGPSAERNWRGLAAQVTAQIQRLHPETAADFKPEDFTPQLVESLVAMPVKGQTFFAPTPVQQPDGSVRYIQYNNQGGQGTVQGNVPPEMLHYKTEFGEDQFFDRRGRTGVPNAPQPSGIGQPPPGVTAPAPAVVPGAAPVNVDISGGITPQVRAALKADMEMHRQGMAPNPAAGTAQVQGGSNAQRSRAFLENYRRGGGQAPAPAPAPMGGDLENKPAIQRKRMESQIDLEQQSALEAEQQANREKNMQAEQDFKRTQTEREAELAINKEKVQDELVTTRGLRQKDAEAKISAQRTLEIIADAEETLPGATGSLGGNLRDKILGSAGVDTEASNKAAQLDIIHGKLLETISKFGGSQVSNYDVQLYEKVVGDVGNRNKPVGDRIAALQEVKKLQQRILAQQAGGAAPKQPEPGKEPPKGLQSAEEIRAAYKAGKMSRDEARQLLQFHGYK